MNANIYRRSLHQYSSTYFPFLFSFGRARFYRIELRSIRLALDIRRNEKKIPK